MDSVRGGGFIDETYEFNAPKYHDFTADSDEECQSNSFFERKRVSDVVMLDIGSAGEANYEETMRPDSLDNVVTTEPVPNNVQEEIAAALAGETKEETVAVVETIAPSAENANPNFELIASSICESAVSSLRAAAAQRSVGAAAAVKSSPRFHPYTRKTGVSAADRLTPSRLRTVTGLAERTISPGKSYTPKSFGRFSSSRTATTSAVAAKSGSTPKASRIPSNSASSTPSSASRSRSAPRLTTPVSPQLRTTSRSRPRRLSSSSAASDASSSTTGSTASNNVVRRLHGRTKKDSAFNAATAPISGGKRTLTMPTSPKFSTASRSRTTEVKSTDEIRRQQAEEAVEQIIKRRRVAAERLRGVLQPASVVSVPVRSVKPLTSPREFKLSTSERKRRIGATKSSDSLSSTGESDGEYVPLSERLKQFERTPDRFHRSREPYNPHQRSASVERIGAMSDSEIRPRSVITSPKEFFLRSASRARITHVKSQKEIEEEELLEARQHQFKALPLNRAILESKGDLGVPRVPKASLTIPQPFSLLSDARAEIRSVSSSDSLSDSEFQFKARKFPKKMFESGPSLPQKKEPVLTEPTSPKLTTASRANLRPCLSGVEPSVEFKANPAPDFSKVFTIKPSDQPLTEIAPFNLHTEAKGEEYSRRLQKRLEEEKEREKAARNFKARPIVYTDSVESLPSCASVEKSLTEPVPFTLVSDLRASVAQQRLQEKIARERAEEENRTHFRARPIIKGKPVEIIRGKAPLIDITAFELNVDKRSQERALFEEKKAEKEAQQLAERRLQEEEKREQEMREIRELRNNMIPKAQPIRHYHIVEAKKSEIPLTEPHSPDLVTEKRAKLRPVTAE